MRRWLTIGFAAFRIALLMVADSAATSEAVGSFTPTGSMAGARHEHTATLLPDGRVMVAGGLLAPPRCCPVALATVELYEPSAGFFSSTGSMAVAREGFTAALLPSGKVLVAGGTSAAVGPFFT